MVASLLHDVIDAFLYLPSIGGPWPSWHNTAPSLTKNKNLPQDLALVPLTFLPKSSVNQTIKEMADGPFSIVVAG